MTKILVLFYSATGTNLAIARAAEAAARDAGADVRIVRARETAPQEAIESRDAWKATLAAMSDIPEATPEDLVWADGIFASSPTRYGHVAGQMQAFFDTTGGKWKSGELNGKAFTAAATAAIQNGGQEATVQALNVTAMHWAAVIVVPGYGDPVKFEDGGNPYGFSMSEGELTETGARSIAYQVGRLVDVAGKIAA